MNEEALVRSVSNGDTDAFRKMIDQYKRLVMHMVARLIDNDLDREELCQDIFMKVYENVGNFRFGSKLSTWIATISYREAINFLKKKQRNQEFEDLDKISFALGREDDSLEKEDFSRFIHLLIDKMPASYKIVLTLYHLDGFSYPEIVEITGMPEGTVKNYLFRARQKLKELSLPYIGKEIHQI